GVAVARAAGSPALLDAVRSAFVGGMDVMLWTCGAIAVASALLAWVFLPRHAGAATGSAGSGDGVEDSGGARPAQLGT
ncbi:MAG: hypothetical protein J2P25_26470, partial [Nocardiopsaceae bacterium]|nr:hypothetical protein [Nocardiopsaceae bacterium]